MKRSLTMRYQYYLGAFLNAMFLLHNTTSVWPLDQKHFEVEIGGNRQKQIDYLATMLCLIDIHSVSIHYELDSQGRFLDRIIAETVSCAPLSITITGHKSGGSNLPICKCSGARLIILLVREVDIEKPMFATLFQIRQKHKFNLYYMIVSEVKMSPDHENLLKKMYKNYNLLNAVVVAMAHDSSDLTVITYNPFNNRTIRLPNKAYKRAQLFVKKNSNIFGSPLNIVMYKDLISTLTGRQGFKMINSDYNEYLPDLISSAMNGTLVLKTPYTNDSKIEDVMAVDLTINGRSYPVDTILGAGVEETIMVRRDDICILLPYNRNRNAFEVLFKTVEPFVWMLMITVIFNAWISLYIFRWTQPRIKLGRKWRHIFLFDLFGLHLNQCLTLMPQKVAPRLIIASCLIYCLVIKSIFEGLLFTTMAKHKDTRISTIDVLLNANEHEILVNDIFYNFSGNFLNKSPIGNRFKLINVLGFVERINSREIYYAYVVRKSGAKFIENVHTIEGSPVYYIMDECVVPFMTCYLVRQGSILLDRINQILRTSEESGLFSYWENQLRNVYDKVQQIEQMFGHHTSINLDHAGFAFQMWIYGLLSATVIFVVECMVFKIATQNLLVVQLLRLKRSRFLSSR